MSYDLEQLRGALRASGGDIQAAAVSLGVAPSTLRNRIKQWEREGQWDPKFLPSLRGEARPDTLRDEILGVIGQVERRPIPKWLTWRPNTKTENRAGTPVLMLSDWHWGESVSLEEMRGVNAYDPEIAAARAKRTLQTSLELLAVYESGPWQGSVLLLLGDIVNGIIHEELRDTSLTTVTRDLITVLPVLRGYIEAFQQEFGKVHVVCCAGNHGRYDYKKRMKGRQEQNFEWILYHFLAAQTQDLPGVTFQIAEADDVPLTVQGTRFLCTHGDRFKGGGGIAGIWSPIQRGIAKTQQRESSFGGGFDYLLMGHWHQLTWGPQFIINGALKGFDEYAMILMATAQTPRQALFVVHDGKGITSKREVLCDGTAAMPQGQPRARFLDGV